MVDLPHPLAPTRTVMLPGAMDREKSAAMRGPSGQENETLLSFIRLRRTAYSAFVQLMLSESALLCVPSRVTEA